MEIPPRHRDKKINEYRKRLMKNWLNGNTDKHKDCNQ